MLTATTNNKVVYFVREERVKFDMKLTSLLETKTGT